MLARSHLNDLLHIVQQPFPLEHTHVQQSVVDASQSAYWQRTAVQLDVADHDQRGLHLPDDPVQDQPDRSALELAQHVERRTDKGPRSERPLVFSGHPDRHCCIQANAGPHDKVPIVGLAHIHGADLALYQNTGGVEQHGPLHVDRQRAFHSLFKIAHQPGQSGSRPQWAERRDAHLQRPHVAGAHWKHPQDGIRADQPVDDLVDGSIAPTGDHHLDPLRCRAARQRGRLARRARPVDDNRPPVLFQVVDDGIQIAFGDAMPGMGVIDEFSFHICSAWRRAMEPLTFRVNASSSKDDRATIPEIGAGVIRAKRQP